MERTYNLTIEFVAGIKEQLTGGNAHEKAFWTEFLKDGQAIEDFYFWYYFETFREHPGFERVAEKLIKREDADIFNDILKRLPEDTANYFLSLATSREAGKEEIIKYLWEKWIMTTEKQFQAPKVFDIHLKPVGVKERFTIVKLENASDYSFDSVQILVKGILNRLIVVQYQKELFDGCFLTLPKAYEGFLRLYGDRAAGEKTFPHWVKLDFADDEK